MTSFLYFLFLWLLIKIPLFPATEADAPRVVSEQLLEEVSSSSSSSLLTLLLLSPTMTEAEPSVPMTTILFLVTWLPPPLKCPSFLEAFVS